MSPANLFSPGFTRTANAIALGANSAYRASTTDSYANLATPPRSRARKGADRAFSKETERRPFSPFNS
jgi:hypothetical protein